MAYCSADDMVDKFGRDELITLTKRRDTPPDTINLPVLERAIDEAQSEINVYLEGRYTLPLASTPLILRDIALDVSRYHLYTRAEKEHPATIRYEQRLTMLRNIAAGKLSLGLDQNNAVAETADTVQFTTGRNDWRGGW